MTNEPTYTSDNMFELFALHVQGTRILHREGNFPECKDHAMQLPPTVWDSKTIAGVYIRDKSNSGFLPILRIFLVKPGKIMTILLPPPMVRKGKDEWEVKDLNLEEMEAYLQTAQDAFDLRHPKPSSKGFADVCDQIDVDSFHRRSKKGGE